MKITYDKFNLIRLTILKLNKTKQKAMKLKLIKFDNSHSVCNDGW